MTPTTRRCRRRRGRPGSHSRWHHLELRHAGRQMIPGLPSAGIDRHHRLEDRRVIEGTGADRDHPWHPARPAEKAAAAARAEFARDHRATVGGRRERCDRPTNADRAGGEGNHRGVPGPTRPLAIATVAMARHDRVTGDFKGDIAAQTATRDGHPRPPALAIKSEAILADSHPSAPGKRASRPHPPGRGACGPAPAATSRWPARAGEYRLTRGQRRKSP